MAAVVDRIGRAAAAIEKLGDDGAKASGSAARVFDAAGADVHRLTEGTLPETQRLLSERTQMLDVQKTAATELAELEHRLDELHAPLQERLRAYEKRVAELEKSLAAKGQENRQLLEAKIQLTRKQLETERARTELEFN